MTELIVGKFYTSQTRGKIEFLAKRKGRFIFWCCEEDMAVDLDIHESLGVILWEEKLPDTSFDRWMNVYQLEDLYCELNDTKKIADSWARDNRIDCLHIRYDSSKPLKERIAVIEDGE